MRRYRFRRRVGPTAASSAATTSKASWRKNPLLKPGRLHQSLRMPLLLLGELAQFPSPIGPSTRWLAGSCNVHCVQSSPLAHSVHFAAAAQGQKMRADFDRVIGVRRQRAKLDGLAIDQQSRLGSCLIRHKPWP